MASVLVMEDDAAQGLRLVQLLESNGHDAVYCRAGSDALTELCDRPFDLLVTDLYVYINGKIVSDGGVALILRVRMKALIDQYSWFRDMPIIAITGATKLPGQKHMLQRTKSMGATAGLEKPFSDEEFMDLVDAVLAKRKSTPASGAMPTRLAGSSDDHTG